MLKGHIALATARFPEGTTGSQLDALARYALWQAGLDYDHGTGHGVGAYLSVHEGPQRISKVANNVALQPGMIVSNEPGYYKTGAYGIRIENLVAVKRSRDRGRRPPIARVRDADPGADRPQLRSMSALLTEAEKAWLNAYHARVREVVAPQVDDGDARLARRGDAAALRATHSLAPRASSSLIYSVHSYARIERAGSSRCQ